MWIFFHDEMCLVFQHLNGKIWRTCVNHKSNFEIYQQNLFCCREIPLCCLFLYTLTNFQVINHLLQEQQIYLYTCKIIA